MIRYELVARKARRGISTLSSSKRPMPFYMMCKLSQIHVRQQDSISRERGGGRSSTPSEAAAATRRATPAHCSSHSHRLRHRPTDQHVLIRRLHQRNRGVRFALHPWIPTVRLEDDGHAIMELSRELAGLRRDDRECLFGFGLLLALPSIPQASERYRLTISAREVVRLSIVLRTCPFEVEDARTPVPLDIGRQGLGRDCRGL